MTIEEIKKAYGRYIYCKKCPVSHTDFCSDPRSCDGQDVAYERIQKLLGGTPSPTTNNVDHPSHYNSGKIECIDAMVESQGVEATKHFCICNAFKYIWRADKKNGLEDIDKAIWYLNKYKELCDVPQAR